MFDHDSCIERLHKSHERLLTGLTGLTDEVARRPSLLPGWSVGHVLAHVARNADSVVRRLDGAARGEVVDQYPGGEDGRAAEIEAGAGLPADDLVADVHRSASAAEQAARSLPEEAWERLTRSLGGGLLPASGVLTGRVREVEVHHVDLGLGYRPGDWPADFVAESLSLELPRLSERVDPAELLGWLTGRGPAPALPDWR